MVNIGASIILNAQEIALVSEVGRERNRDNRFSCVQDQLLADTSESVNKDICGVLGEYAFTRLFGLPFDFLTSVRSVENGTDDGDCDLDGLRVDVHTNAARYLPATQRYLLRPFKKAFCCKIDVFALMLDENPKFVFKGFMLKTDLVQERRLVDFGRGASYCARQDELLTLEEVKERLRSVKDYGTA